MCPLLPAKKRVARIKAHGAHIHPISGSREDTAAAAIRQVEKEGAFYASHIYNPFFHQGTKTYVYELYEQLGGRLPDVLIVSVGNGTLLLGVFRGLEDLRRWGMLEKVPLVLAVQAQNLFSHRPAFASGGDHWQPVPTSPTEAEGIAIAAPARGDEMLAALRAWGGQCITVTEEQILTAREQLARRGIYVETTSAANLAALAQYQHACPNWQKQCIGGTCLWRRCQKSLKNKLIKKGDGSCRPLFCPFFWVMQPGLCCLPAMPVPNGLPAAAACHTKQWPAHRARTRQN